jgi:transcriptional regulator with XRE-family HTH domain
MKRLPAETFAAQVGRRLARGRDAAGMSQAELARRLRISPQRLSNWENGGHMLPPEYLGPIFAITRLDANWLFLDDPSKLPADIYKKLFSDSEQEFA